MPLAIAGSRWLASTLFGLTPGDPISFGVALAAVALVTIGASLVPARRAATLDPMRALRSEVIDRHNPRRVLAHQGDIRSRDT